MDGEKEASSASRGEQPSMYHYHTGTGDHYALYPNSNAAMIPEYKPTFSWSCCCHHTTNFVVLAIVAGFLGFACYICYYVLNNGGG
mmetsp:Transcript_26125/g.56590  ORF Transcript_26125/g.56590 Transcript_26125/m.56590 type:complete len:86 (-) Transcript_26125:1062-1319(-)